MAQLQDLFGQLEQALVLQQPRCVYIGGEAAAQIHCGHLAEGDVDVEFDARHVAMLDISVGDRPSLRLRRRPWIHTMIPSDYRSRAQSLNLGTTLLRTFILAPSDIAVGLIGQGESERWIEDLVRHQLVSAREIEGQARMVIEEQLAGGKTIAEESLERVLDRVRAIGHPQS